MLLKDYFIAILKSFGATKSTIDKLWNEIEIEYTSKNRYYHTLAHLEKILLELEEVKSRIADWPTILFSLYYHDIIYNIRKSNNELKSAEFAEDRMQSLGIPKEKIEKCKEQIIATSSHKLSDDLDTNYFLDADLAVLGCSRGDYKIYSEDIRKEYRIYPDLFYNTRRKKVIKYFLSREQIYKTGHFYDKYEVQARENLQWELKNLE
jgi:predicted metal-dependent HD superfamily phosphohydrolase